MIFPPPPPQSSFFSFVYYGEEVVQGISAFNGLSSYFKKAQKSGLWESWLLLAFPLGC